MTAVNASMHYVGLDVHQRCSSVCILDPCGKPVKQFKVKGTWSELIQELGKLPRPFSICYEASCGYGYLYERLSSMAARVSVAHPGQLRLIYRSKKKNDRVDASKLAKLLYVDAVPPVHVPCAGVRAWRGLIVYRQRLVERRSAVKSQVRSMLRGQGIAAPGGKRLFSGKGLKWLKEQQLPDLPALQRDMGAEELQELTQKIQRVNRQLDYLAEAHPGVTLLKTIPGVGVRTAEAVVAYMDEVARFSSNRKLGSYFGLVPCQDQSAGKDRLGHITGDGPAVVRRLLCEASWQAIRSSPTIRAYFQRIMNKDPDRKKIALIATAHHVLRVMGAMLRSGEVWRESVQSAAEAPALSPPEDTGPVSWSVSSDGGREQV